jgi:hypothetical protein
MELGICTLLQLRLPFLPHDSHKASLFTQGHVGIFCSAFYNTQYVDYVASNARMIVE